MPQEFLQVGQSLQETASIGRAFPHSVWHLTGKGVAAMLLSLLGALRMFFFTLNLNLTASSFPRPLSAAQERECLERLRAGDPAARDELIEHHLRLVVHIVKKYYPAQRDGQEDLISIGTIGLIKAVQTFNSEKGSRFATYAARCIENAILPPARFCCDGGMQFSRAVFLLDILCFRGKGRGTLKLNGLSIREIL